MKQLVLFSFQGVKRPEKLILEIFVCSLWEKKQTQLLEKHKIYL